MGLLAGLLGGRYLGRWPRAFLGLLVAAWTADSEGWRYAAGFMLSGAGLVAAGVAATRLAICSVAYCSRTTLTDFGGRRSTSAPPLPSR